MSDHMTKEMLANQGSSGSKEDGKEERKIWQKHKTGGTWRPLVEHRNKNNAMI